MQASAFRPLVSQYKSDAAMMTGVYHDPVVVSSDSASGDDEDLQFLQIGPVDSSSRSVTRRHENRRHSLKHDDDAIRRHSKAQLAFKQDENGFTTANLAWLGIPRSPSLEVKSSQHAVQHDFETVVHPLQKLETTIIPRKRVTIKAPYFTDPHFMLRMYCGPGFEHFPCSFDENNETHQSEKSAWDEKVHRYVLNSGKMPEWHENDRQCLEVEEDYPDFSGAIPLVDCSECLVRVLEILPDIDQDYAIAVIKDTAAVQLTDKPNSDDVIEAIFQLGQWPTMKAKLQKQELHPLEKETGKTVKFTRPETNKVYHDLAKQLLRMHFLHVPLNFIEKIFKEKQNLWDATIAIAEHEENYFTRSPRPYQRAKQARTVAYQQSKSRSRKWPPPSYAHIVNEFQAVKQELMRQKIKESREQNLKQAELDNLEDARFNNQLVECKICFDDEIPMNRAVPCKGQPVAHFFCYDCTRRQAENQVGMMKYEMKCMEPDGCLADLDTETVARAVPVTTFDRLAFNEQQDAISRAGIEGLEQCPFCDFKAICDPIEEDSIFSCQNQECFKVTCRLCKGVSHLPKTCDQNKKDNILDTRHKVEEARSQAMLRPCPKCRINIIKESGCNKMRCTCGAIMCYVCKRDISGGRDPYKHFIKSGRNGADTGTCPLYDKEGEDRHAHEADHAEEMAIAEAKAVISELDEGELRVGSGMAKGKNKEKQVTEQRAHGRLAAYLDHNDEWLHWPFGGQHDLAQAVIPDAFMEPALAGIRVRDVLYADRPPVEARAIFQPIREAFPVDNYVQSLWADPPVDQLGLFHAPHRPVPTVEAQMQYEFAAGHAQAFGAGPQIRNLATRAPDHTRQVEARQGMERGRQTSRELRQALDRDAIRKQLSEGQAIARQTDEKQVAERQARKRRALVVSPRVHTTVIASPATNVPAANWPPAIVRFGMPDALQAADTLQDGLAQPAASLTCEQSTHVAPIDFYDLMDIEDDEWAGFDNI